MSITSLTFFAFIFGVLIIYYAIPKKLQWCVLLCASVIFYLSFGIRSIIYVFITAITVFFATNALDRLSNQKSNRLKSSKDSLSKEDKALIKRCYEKKRRAVMIVALLINLIILFIFKYYHFAFQQVNSAIRVFGGKAIEDTASFIVPLGISFYTFQAVGYLVDIYWEYYKPERNFFKVLLFVCFFPQITQGPISDFEQLSKELFSEHTLNYKNYSWGFQRMMWGFMKKMVIADNFAPYVKTVFTNYNQYSGISVLIGAFMYSIQIYADFSGYMDIMCGYCEMLGIRIVENFERPYFSKSVTEYWRRWHITLGAWFKKYIYYPIGMSKWSRSLAKKLRGRYGKHFADNVPATLALLIVWTCTGLWHGASWAYITWGLVNGAFIIFSLWMEPIYASVKSRLKINESSRMWIGFQVIRTFVLVTFIKVLPEVGTLSQGVGYLRRIFTNHNIPRSIITLLPFVDLSSSLYSIPFFVATGFVVLLFCASLLQRKKMIREYFAKLPFAVRIVLLVGLTLIIITFGVRSSWGQEGFLYANF